MLKFRTESELKKAFETCCQQKGLNPSQVLRDFVRHYLVANSRRQHETQPNVHGGLSESLYQVELSQYDISHAIAFFIEMNTSKGEE